MSLTADSRRVLVVDDEPSILNLFRTVLSRPPDPGQASPFELSLCLKGDEGLDAARAALSQGRPFTMAFVDIHLSPGPDGVWTAQHLREMDPGVEIVMMTGYTDIDPTDIAARILPPERLLFLHKPLHAYEVRHFATSLGAKWVSERRLESNQAELESAVAEKTAALAEANEKLSRELERRRMALLALRDTSRRYRSLFHNSHAAMLLFDSETGQVVDANKAALRFYGYSKAEITKLTGKDINVTENLGNYRALLHRIRENPYNYFQFKHKLANGVVRDVDVYTGPLNLSGRSLLYSIIHDATEARRAQRALAESEERYRLLVNAMQEGLIIVDAEGLIKFANPSLARMLGYEMEEVIGRKVDDFLDEANRQIRHQERAKRRTGSNDPYELKMKTKPGGEIVTLVSPQGIFDARGQLTDVIAMITDITKRKTLEAQLLQAQKLESIGQLAAGIAHEINTPAQYVADNTRFLQDSFLSFIKVLAGYEALVQAAKSTQLQPEMIAQAEEAGREAEVDYLIEEVPKAIAQSLEGIDRISTIVRAMKEFAHPGAKQKTLVDVNKSIENTVMVARNEWKYVAEMDLDLDPALPLVVGLPGELNQVFLNIIVNAAHAIEAKGKPDPQANRIRVATKAQKGGVEIRISDTGTGIPESIRNRVFDPFFTTKPPGKGTGQGLAIAYSVLVDKHGGSISLESQPGQGTTFIIKLPVGEESEAENEPRAGGRAL